MLKRKTRPVTASRLTALPADTENGPYVCLPSTVTLYVRVMAVPSLIDRVRKAMAATRTAWCRSMVIKARFPKEVVCAIDVLQHKAAQDLPVRIVAGRRRES